MAFETAVASLAIGLVAAALAGFGALQTRRLRRAEEELEAASDAWWEAEGRAERLEAEGARAIAAAEARAEAGARAKARFLATVSHEMRTPLSGVIGTAQLLLETRLAPEQRAYAGAIRGSAEAMLSLVDEILDVSRLEADGPTVEPAPFEVARLVEEVAELLAPRANAKGLDLATFVSLEAPSEIVADAARTRQVLLNLAGNAIKFTPSGGVGLRVEAAAGGVRFSVHDTGPGFPAEDRERLFEEFEQGEAGQAAGGVGLGLSISRRLAAAMGGSLDAETAPGAGAVFSLTLPHAGDDAARPARPLDGRRAVVVSDAPFSGPWLVESLVGLGVEATLIDPATGAEETARLIATLRPDVAAIDRGAADRAPGLAGLARSAGAARVLLMLSPAERRDLAEQLSRGFDGYIVKPLRAGSLVSRFEGPGDAADLGAPEGEQTSIAFPGAGLKILVAEDDPVSALIALAHLARLGHASVHVPDGAAACDAFERERFDVVLLDLRMPRLDGCATARRMRQIEVESARPAARLIALTANVGAEDREAALAAGMDELLAKPLDRRALEALIEPLREPGAQAA